jgi:hypothetical protein
MVSSHFFQKGDSLKKLDYEDDDVMGHVCLILQGFRGHRHMLSEFTIGVNCLLFNTNCN